MSMNNLVRVQEEFLGKTHCQGHHDLSLGTAQRMSVKMVPIYVVSQSHSSCRTRSRAPLRMASGAGGAAAGLGATFVEHVVKGFLVLLLVDGGISKRFLGRRGLLVITLGGLGPSGASVGR